VIPAQSHLHGNWSNNAGEAATGKPIGEVGLRRVTDQSGGIGWRADMPLAALAGSCKRERQREIDDLRRLGGLAAIAALCPVRPLGVLQ
jgi:hypothetical protein